MFAYAHRIPKRSIPQRVEAVVHQDRPRSSSRSVSTTVKQGHTTTAHGVHVDDPPKAWDMEAFQERQQNAVITSLLKCGCDPEDPRFSR